MRLSLSINFVMIQMQAFKYKNIQLSNNLFIDFNKLALLDPSLRRYVFILNQKVAWNFTTQESVVALTQAIMNHLFKFQWKCPSNNLCPRIPSRVNYLLWICAVVKEPVQKVLDIGTGATLIYPLIGWRLFKWQFIAVEVNQASYQSSKNIRNTNDLQKVIDLRLSLRFEQETILKSIIKEDEIITIVVCNPPFFEEDSHKLSQMEDQQHHIQCGQYGFFFNLYKDSFHFRNIKFWSCLIGRKTDFDDIKIFLVSQNEQQFTEQVRFGEINQGNNKRFIVFWRIKHDLPSMKQKQ